MRYEIPKGTPTSTCKGCGEFIKWVKTPNGKNVPVNADGICHFDTCTKRGQVRQKLQVIIAPHKFNSLLDDLKEGIDAIEEVDAEGHEFLQRLLLNREDGKLHQMTQSQFDWLERLHEEYCA